jgi:CRP-like cAMP-binding protein
MTLNPLPHQNGLLAALPSDVVARLEPHLEPVPLSLGKVLYEAGGTARHVYFPVECVVSMLYTMRNGASVEIAKIGHEGLIGLSLFMSGQRPPSRAVVQSSGAAYRILGSRLKLEFDRHADLMALMLRYTQALITQMAQVAVCNRHHNIDQQLCRWLLLSLDRLPTNQIIMTQELIANNLGVRREGVTEAARKLQKQQVIEYSRGRIVVLDRPRLEQLSCECYAQVRCETDRLLPRPAARYDDALRHDKGRVERAPVLPYPAPSRIAPVVWKPAIAA